MKPLSSPLDGSLVIGLAYQVGAKWRTMRYARDLNVDRRQSFWHAHVALFREAALNRNREDDVLIATARGQCVRFQADKIRLFAGR